MALGLDVSLPSIENLARTATSDREERHMLYRPDSVALNSPLGLGVKKCPELCQRWGVELASTGKPIQNRLLRYPNASSGTRGAIRSLGRGIPGTRAALFSNPAQSLPMNERNSIRDRSLIQARLLAKERGRSL